MSSDESFRLAELEGLVPALLKVYSLVYDMPYPQEGNKSKLSTPQEIVEAVRTLGSGCALASKLIRRQADDFKRRLQVAKEAVDLLPGGELDIEGQDEVIKMLEKWRDLKR